MKTLFNVCFETCSSITVDTSQMISIRSLILFFVWNSSKAVIIFTSDLSVYVCAFDISVVSSMGLPYYVLKS